jgi:hypothetical protein
MPERYPVIEKKPWSETGQDHEAFAIACLQRMISEAKH